MRESFSGIQYKGIVWGNYWGNPDKYLKKLDIGKIQFKKEKINDPKIITKLVVNGVRVKDAEITEH